MQNLRLDATFMVILSICLFALAFATMQQVGILTITMLLVTSIVLFGLGVVVWLDSTNQKKLAIVRTIEGWIFAITCLYWFFILLS